MNQQEAFRETLGLCEDRWPSPMSGALSIEHMRDMLRRIDANSDATAPDGFSAAKLGRWLGYLQGVAVALDVMSLDECKEINKKWAGDAAPAIPPARAAGDLPEKLREHARELSSRFVGADRATADLLEAAAVEIERLRQILSECASAIGAGAFAAPSCSLDFLASIPREIAASCSAARDLTWFWQVIDRDGLVDVPSDEKGALATLVRKTSGLSEALAEQLWFHRGEDKALSKSGRGDADYYYRRSQHAAQIAAIRKALNEADEEKIIFARATRAAAERGEG